MTENMTENIENVKKLRSGGWGYKRIAKALGLTRDTVRGISKHLELTGYRGDVPIKKVKPPLPAWNCSYCGKPLSNPPEGHRGPRSRYCDEHCRREKDKKEKFHRRHEVRPFLKFCPSCGIMFNTHDPDIVHCSTKCASVRLRGPGGRFAPHISHEIKPEKKRKTPLMVEKLSHRQRLIQARRHRVETKKRLAKVTD